MIKVHKITGDSILLFLLVLLPIYQDSPLSSILGAAGYSLLMPMSLILFVLHVVQSKKISRNIYLVDLFKLGVWMLIVSFVAIIIWVGLGNSIVVVGEFLPWKALKVCLQYFSYPAYTYLLYYYTRKEGLFRLEQFCFIVLMILTILCYFESLQSPYAFRELHFAASFPYWRIRLLTLESSWTSMMIYVYSFIALYWALATKKRLLMVITMICIGTLIFNTGSKSLMLCSVLTFLLYVIFSLRRLKKSTIFALGIIALGAVIATYFVLPKFLDAFSSDLQNYTSISTRLYTSVIGLAIGIIIPTGVGGAVYLAVFQDVLSTYMNWFQSLPFNFNMNEIIDLATKVSDEALTVKSGILHYNMYWGIIGTVFLFNNFVKLSREIRSTNATHNEFILAVFWTSVILLFSVNFTFEFWLLYVFLLSVCVNNAISRIANIDNRGKFNAK